MKPSQTSVVKLGDGCHSAFAREDFLQRTHGDHQGDVGLAVAGHVRAAVSKRCGVDGELQGSTGVASSHVANQYVVVHGFALVCGFGFRHVFTSPEVGSPGIESIA